jgi:hypothetical protein
MPKRERWLYVGACDVGQFFGDKSEPLIDNQRCYIFRMDIPGFGGTTKIVAVKNFWRNVNQHVELGSGNRFFHYVPPGVLHVLEAGEHRGTSS